MCRQPDCLCRKSDGLYKKLLELLSAFSLVARYGINIQKSVVFLYTSYKQDTEF